MVLHVFEPAMCCNSGLCGATVDEVLLRFAADLRWLARRGVTVHRHDLAHEPEVFAAEALIAETLSRDGPGSLPLGLLAGELVFQGRYPDRDELSRLVDTVPRRSP